ncbi:SRPBCC family protein [Streptomyces sp. LX-29]|nr:SRPBCC family protein [Streptomyces sp. LX-29]WFB11894.1 SRPBCC family protein [Streptomyces sp. LX-29]
MHALAGRLGHPARGGVELRFQRDQRSRHRHGATWPDWCSSVDASSLEREGVDGREGPGAVRRFAFRGRTTRAEILEVRAHRLLRYRLLSGLPFFGYEGLATVHPGRIRWDLSFHVKVPGRGRYWHRYMQEFLNEFVRELAVHAERQATGDRPPTCPGGQAGQPATGPGADQGGRPA